MFKYFNRILVLALFILIETSNISMAVEILQDNSYNYSSPLLDVKQLSLSGIKPNDTSEKVEKILGKPDKTEEHSLQGGYRIVENKVWFYKANSILVSFTDNKVTAIDTSNKELKTPDNISIGSTKADMIKAYGDIPFYKQTVNENYEVYTYRAEDKGKKYIIKLNILKGVVSNIVITSQREKR